MNSFTQRNLKWFGAAVVVVVLAAGFFWISRHSGTTELQKAKFTLGKKDMPKVRSSFSPKNTDDAISRIEWEINRFKDPTLGRVPNNIRERELAFARNIPTRESLGKTNSPGAVNWSSRGPYNVGGRTRALATDLDYNGSSNQRILAGGISGGMYRSENGGNSWTLTTALDAHASVTCVAQDPSNHNTWYYGTGEYIGNSANGRFSANFYGHGMFKSTNGGASWTQLASTSNNDPQVFDDFFDFVWNVVVTSNGTVFAATYGGILRSTDGGSNWSLVLGRNQSPYSSATDVAVAANGDIYATLSRNGTNITEYGVYRSTNNGANWSNITPTGMNTDPNRIVIATAPSDGNTAYAFIQFGNGARASDHQLYRYNASGNSWSNLSANIPDFSDNFGGQVGVFSSQGGYDLLVKVKPDNANVLWLGGTNLVRSTNGGSSFEWVGGYHPQNFVWDNHHSDQHSITFLPNNPNAMISGSDGGLSFTNNCLASPQTWSFINNGYLTTQFYAISIDAQGGNELVGGLQDNGTWIAQTADPNTAWISIFSGDGAYNAISPGGSAYYVSSQQGNTFRITFPGGQQTYSN
ncbi:MAG: exo-alpha-sialidase, partial [Calditrichaeota bacterium]|nr:exo-alpha-sialidase [Calditrichota bacterium]